MHEQKSVRDTFDIARMAHLAEVAVLEHFPDFHENPAQQACSLLA